MSSRGRLLLAILFTTAGVIAWAVLLWAFEPAAYGIVRADPDSSLPYVYGDFNSPYISQVLAGKVVRWSALLLGVGGLLIGSLGRRRGPWPALGFGLAWVAVDLTLDLTNVDSFATAVVAAAAVAGGAATTAMLIRRDQPATTTGLAAWPLLYAGVALAFSSSSFAALVFSNVYSGPYLIRSVQAPAGLLTGLRGVLIVLSVLLVWSASVASAALGPASGRRRLARVAVTLLSVTLAVVPFLPSSIAAWRYTWLTVAFVAVVIVIAVPAAVLMLIAVIPLGALPRGARGLLRFAGLSLAAVVLFLPLGWATEVPPGPGPVGSYLIPKPPDSAADRYLTFPFAVILGLTLGLMALTAARLLAAWYHNPESSVDSSGSELRGWRPAAGSLLAALGIAGWAVVAAVVEPVVSAFRLSHSSNFSVHRLTAFVMLGKDLRWAAMLVAVGGLVVLARARGRRRAVTAGVIGWVVADFALDWTSLGGWLMAAGAALAVGAAFVVLLGTGRPRRVGGSGPLPLGYSAVAIGVASLLFINTGRWMLDYAPLWMVSLAAGVGVLLVVAAVVNALAAAATVGAGRGVAAILIGVAGAAAVILHGRWRLSPSIDRVSDYLVQRWVSPLAAAALVLACVLLAGGIGQSRRSRLGSAIVAGSAVFVAPSIMYGAYGLGFTAQFGLLPLLGERAFVDDAYPMLLIGMWYGLPLGLLCLLPRALATPLAESQPAPAPPDPVPLGARLARAGVPEILEHPPGRVGQVR